MEEKANKGMKARKGIVTGLLVLSIGVITLLLGKLFVLAVTTEALNVDMSDWLQNRGYRSSDTLSRHVYEDMYSIMDYISLKQLLEEDDGTLDLDRTVLAVENEDETITSYTMRDLIALGEECGIYVYDSLMPEDGRETAYSYQSDWSSATSSYGHELGEGVNVLWSIMSDSDAVVSVGEDAWATRTMRMEAAIRTYMAEDHESGVTTLLPETEELRYLTTDELLDFLRALPSEYPDVSAPSQSRIQRWEQLLADCRKNAMVEETVAVAVAPTEVSDEGEEAREESETEDDWYVIYTDGYTDEYGVFLVPEEDEIREGIFSFLQNAREIQKESITYLYDLVQSFLLDYLQEYYVLRNQWENTESNLHYRIVLEANGETVEYSDPDTNSSFNPVEGSSVYYTYNSASQSVESTLQEWIWDTPISLLRNRMNLTYSKATIALGVNLRSDSYEDAYYKEYISYDNYRSQIFTELGGILVSGILLLVTMIWLMVLSGHKEGVEGIYLNAYDRLPTEIGAAGAVAICVGAAGMIWLMANVLNSYEYYASDIAALLLAGCMTAIAILFCLALWLGFYGLIRRIKAHTFWKNSLVYYSLCWCMKPLRWCGRKIKQGWTLLLDAGDTTWKTLAVFAIYFLINFVWCTNLRYAGALEIVLLLSFNAVVALFLVWKAKQLKEVHAGVKKIADGQLDYQLPLQDLNGEAKRLAIQINHISEGLKNAIEDSIKNERMKTDLITNVSHDIKTPLTSIINYVDLLKRENIQDSKVQNYIDILDKKSQRLKQLTEDLVEASKASSGTLRLHMEKIDFVELIHQTNGEFIDRLQACDLTVVPSIPDTPSYIMADGRYVWRILENLYRNAEKYAMPNTRVYIDVFEKCGRIFFVMKNVSKAPLNIKADELTERFIRGDVSRSTEGSGLGLSIAKDMTELMNGTFKIYLDGDLFRVTVSFAVIHEKKTDLKEMEENIRRRMEEEESKAGVRMEPDRSVEKGVEDTQDSRRIHLSVPRPHLPLRRKAGDQKKRNKPEEEKKRWLGKGKKVKTVQEESAQDDPFADEFFDV